MMSQTTQRLNIPTIISVSLIAFGLESVVHEVLGHAVTAWLTGVSVVLISSTAMQTEGGSKLVAASGPIANLLFGVVAYLFLRRLTVFNSLRLFLWIFAFSNLFLCTGYILYSGLMNFGDAAIVISGFHPVWIFRGLLIACGALGYRYSVRLGAGDLLNLIRKGTLQQEDISRILYSSCAAGVLLYLIASFFNPVSPSLILYDGVSEASGVLIGFTLVAQVVMRLSRDYAGPEASRPGSIRFSLAWVASASVFTVLFMIFLGRGVRLR